MKKHDEGYALPFVLVVMLVMCAIAVSVMSFSLRNLQVQQASIQKMQAKYEAAAKIEQVIAIAQTKNATIKEDESLEFEIPKDADEKSENVLKVVAADTNKTVWIIAEFVPSTADGDLTITFNSENGTLTVMTAIELKCQRYEMVDKETAMEFLPFQDSTEGEVNG